MSRTQELPELHNSELRQPPNSPTPGLFRQLQQGTPSLGVPAVLALQPPTTPQLRRTLLLMLAPQPTVLMVLLFIRIEDYPADNEAAVESIRPTSSLPVSLPFFAGVPLRL